MEVVWEGRTAGVFRGYRGGRVHELSDGTRWLQESRTEEYVYRERPKVRLRRDRGTGIRYLDVEGTSAVGEVVPDSGMRGMKCGGGGEADRRESSWGRSGRRCAASSGCE